MRKLSLVTLAASLILVPSAMAATMNGVHTTWVDTRTHITYNIVCNETQTGSDKNRTESFSCTPDGAKAPAGTYNSPHAFWNSDFPQGGSAKNVHVTIDDNGNLTGTAKQFQPDTMTVSTTWTDSRTGTTYYIRCDETMTDNGTSRTETFDCRPDGNSPKAPAGTYGPAQHAYWDSDFTPGLHSDSVNVTIDKNGRLTGSATYDSGGGSGNV